MEIKNIVNSLGVKYFIKVYEKSQLRSIVTTESHDTNFQYLQSVTEFNKRFHLKSVIY